MKKFALVNRNLVINTVVAENQPEDIQEGVFVEVTSETNDPGIGSTYNFEKGKFVLPQPYASWVLDEDTCIWGAPEAKPATGYYRWDESQLSWIEMVN